MSPGRQVRHFDLGRGLVRWSVAAICLTTLGIPLLFILLASFRGPPEFLPIEEHARWTLENFSRIYSDKALYTEVLPNTAILAGGSLFSACFTALIVAWRFERGASRGRTVARILVLAPMALPTPALVVAWIRLLGPNAGWINQGWRHLSATEEPSGPFNIFSMGGMIWCQSLAAVPVAYLLLAPAVRAVRWDLEEAGYAAGAPPRNVFRRISMPTAWRVFLGPLLVMIMAALEQVDVPYILGPTADIHVLGTRILYEMTTPSGLPNLGGTSALAMLMLLLVCVAMVIHGKLVRVPRIETNASLHRNGRSEVRSKLGLWLTWGAVGGYFLIAFVVPLATMVFQATGFGQMMDTGGSFPGSGALASLVEDDRFARALLNTLAVAATSALLGTATGTAIAMCVSKTKDRLGRALDKLSMSSVAMPPVVVAYGVAVLFLSLPIGLYGTIGLLALAYSYRIALATRLTAGAIAQLGQGPQEAAGVSGARWVRTQVSIVLPVILPSIGASIAFLFVVGIKEFTIPLMLYSPDNVVLSVLLLQFSQAGHPEAAAAVGLAMTTLTILAALLLMIALRSFNRLQGTK